MLKEGQKPACCRCIRLWCSRWVWSRVTRIFSRILLNVEVSWMSPYEETAWIGLWGLWNMSVCEVFQCNGKIKIKVYIWARSCMSKIGASLKCLYVILSGPGADWRLRTSVCMISSGVISVVSGCSGSGWSEFGWTWGELMSRWSAGCLRKGLKGTMVVKIVWR